MLISLVVRSFHITFVFNVYKITCIMKTLDNFVGFAGVVILLLLPGLVLAQANQSVADRKFDMGYYTAAVGHYTQLAERGELTLDGYLKLGTAFLMLNEPFTGESYLLVGQRKDTDEKFPEFSLLLGHAAMQQGNYTGARVHYLDYSSEDPVASRQLASNARTAAELVRSEPNARVYNMPWNSPGAEMSLSVLNDRLVFVSRSSHDMSDCPAWDCDPDGALLETEMGNHYEVEGLLRSELRRDQPVAMISYSGCGSKVAFVRDAGDPNSSKADPLSNAMSLYLAEVDENGDWDKVTSFPFNSANYSSGFPHLNSDGTSLYFASNKPGGFGGYDLYVSHYDGDDWTEPENLGPEINTPGNEVSPFMAEDVLFFASDYHPGMGGLDIFYTSLDNPVNIINAGRGINSARDDFGIWLNEDGKTGYFISNRPGGRGLEDIYGFTAENSLIDLNALPPALAEVEETEEADQGDWISFVPSGISTADSKEEVEEQSVYPQLEFVDEFDFTPQADIEPAEVVEVTESAPKYEFIEIDRRTNRHPLVQFASHFLNSSGDTNDKKSNSSARLRNNYTIQVASLKSEFDDQQFARKLKDVGDVFKVFYNSDTKIRVGSYNTREMAEAALPQVRERGFGDAFIVLEQIVVNPAQGSQRTESGQLSSARDSDKPKQADPDTKAEDSNLKTPSATYYVRLGAFRDMRFFDDSVWEDYTVEKKQENDITVVMVGGFDRIEDIEDVRLKAVRNGFSDAFIVIEYNGERRRY